MLRFAPLFVVVVMAGCGGCDDASKPPLAGGVNLSVIGGNPELFRQAIEQQIANKQYSAAVELVNQTDVRALADYSGKSQDFRWMAVYEDALVFPGLDDNLTVSAQPSDYWILPGTSDAIVDARWQASATKFAAKYNQLLRDTRRSDVGDPSR